MADPVTALGAAAGAVQIVDVALRASKEIHGFLSAIKHAGKEVRALREALRDVETNTRSLREYISRFSRSKAATDEFEILPNSITGTLIRFHDDILAIKTLLPSKPTPDLAEKIQWACDKRKVAGVVERLNQRKADLSIALSIVGRLQEFRCRQDLAMMRKSAETTKDVIIEQQEISRSQINLHTDVVADRLDTTIRTTTKNLLRQHASGIARQIKSIDEQAKQTQEQQAELLGYTRQLLTSVDSLRGEHLPQTMFRELQQLSNNMRGDIKGFSSSTTIAVSDTDMLTAIIRSELRSQLRPLIEQNLERFDTRYEERCRHMDLAVDQICNDFGNHLHLDAARYSATCMQVSRHRMDQDLAASHGIETYNTPAHCRIQGLMKTTIKRSWYKKWSIGSFSINLEHRNRRDFGSLKRNSSTTLTVSVIPSQAWMTLPGVALIYSSGLDQHGFYQLTPTIATFPVIPNYHRIWYVLNDRDIKEVQKLFASGDAHPRARTEDGRTLLHIAAFRAQPDLCRLFLSYGLSWVQTDHRGHSAHSSVVRSIFRLRARKSFSNVSSANIAGTVQLLIDQGVDLQDSSDVIVRSWTTEKLMPHFDEETYTSESYVPYIESLRSHHGIDTWSLHLIGNTWAEPTQPNLKTLEYALDLGLDPNFLSHKECDPRSLLVRALDVLFQFKKRTLSNQETTHSGSWFEGITPKPWCLVTALIRAGADIYWMDSENSVRVTDWRAFWTPWAVARGWGLEDEWFIALQECGLDPDEVCREDIRRSKEALRLHGAKRSGVDVGLLLTPPVGELRCRRCCRKRCYRGHGQWPFLNFLKPV